MSENLMLASSREPAGVGVDAGGAGVAVGASAGSVASTPGCGRLSVAPGVGCAAGADVDLPLLASRAPRLASHASRSASGIVSRSTLAVIDPRDAHRTHGSLHLPPRTSHWVTRRLPSHAGHSTAIVTQNVTSRQPRLEPCSAALARLSSRSSCWSCCCGVGGRGAARSRCRPRRRAGSPPGRSEP